MGREDSDEVFEPDMDRIEATIRRVQAQAAAHQPEPEVDDPIEATIRRVQAQAAAQAEAPIGGVVEDDIEATIRRVQAQAASHAAGSADSVAGSIEEAVHNAPVPVEPSPQTVEVEAAESEDDFEDPIEATIRRVRAQAEAQRSEHRDPEAPPTDGDSGSHAFAEEDSIEATIRRVQEQASTAYSTTEIAADAGDRDPLDAAIDAAERAVADIEAPNGDSRPEPTSWPGADERLLGEAGSWEIAARRLEQGLQDALREIRALSARIDELEDGSRSLPAGISDQEEGPTILPMKRPVSEEWDDRPQISAMAFGAPPRPAIMRDPSPQTATAEELVPTEPEDVPERPAARLRALDDAGNLDARIPRQYRITVEDKRRGVDLVPLHRAMQGIENVRDMSLLSYSNGVAMLLVESVGALDPETLRMAVARVMSRDAKVEVHNEQTMVVKIQED